MLRSSWPFNIAFDQLNLFPKRVHIRRNRPFEVAHLAFVVVPHVDQNRVVLGRNFIEPSPRPNARRCCARRMLRHCSPSATILSRTLTANLKNDLPSSTVDVRAELRSRKEMLYRCSWKSSNSIGGNGDLRIDPFVGDVGPAPHTEVRSSEGRDSLERKAGSGCAHTDKKKPSFGSLYPRACGSIAPFDRPSCAVVASCDFMSPCLSSAEGQY